MFVINEDLSYLSSLVVRKRPFSVFTSCLKAQFLFILFPSSSLIDFPGAALNSCQRFAASVLRFIFALLFCFSEQQAKAQKKEMEAKKKYTIEDSVRVLTTTSTEQSLAAQAKTYFTSRMLTTNDGSEANVTSQKISKHQYASGKKEDTTSMKAVSRPSFVNTQVALESTEPTQRDTKPAESNASRSPPPGKPLRERQLIPLPHFGELIPPPTEFAGYSGKGETTLTGDNSKGYCLDALNLVKSRYNQLSANGHSYAGGSTYGLFFQFPRVSTDNSQS